MKLAKLRQKKKKKIHNNMCHFKGKKLYFQSFFKIAKNKRRMVIRYLLMSETNNVVHY